MTPTSSPSSLASEQRTAGWIAAASVALPFLQALPIDFDRTAPFVVLLPVLWFGRRQLADATADLTRGPRWLRFAVGLLGAAMIISTMMSPHPAPALVTVASWVLLAAAGVIAGRLSRRSEAANRLILTGLAVGAAAGAAMMWLLWLTSGRGAIPLYAHHRLFGLHMLVGAMATTGLVVRSDRISASWRWCAVGAITWGAVLWSGGRAPLLALAGGLLGWFALRAGNRKKLAVAVAVQGLAGLAVSAAFSTNRAELGWQHALSRTAAAAQEGGVDLSVLTSTRTDFWRAAAKHALASPWFGHGADAYRFLTPKLDGQQPHNLILQLWLDFGVVGALPALVGLAGILVIAWKNVRQSDGAPLAPWAALLTTLLLAGMLDGVFYHALLLLPVMITLGVVTSYLSRDRHIASHRPRRRAGMFCGVAISGAAAISLLHAVLFYLLAVATPPATPNAVAARLVRAFPSTTFGLWTWLDGWYQANPDAAVAWARWAQAHATNPAIFHIRAAQYLHARGEHAAALEELRLAEARAHPLARPGIVELRKSMLASP